MDLNEERILTRLRKLANRWARRHRTAVLDFDDYLSIGMIAMFETQQTWAGTDPPLLESLILKRANWDMCSAAWESIRKEKRIDRIDPELAAPDDDDPVFTDENKRQDLRDLLTHALPPSEAELAIAYLVEGKTLGEIAKESGLPKARLCWYWESLRQQMKTNPLILRFLEDCQDA